MALNLNTNFTNIIGVICDDDLRFKQKIEIK